MRVLLLFVSYFVLVYTSYMRDTYFYCCCDFLFCFCGWAALLLVTVPARTGAGAAGPVRGLLAQEDSTPEKVARPRRPYLAWPFVRRVLCCLGCCGAKTNKCGQLRNFLLVCFFCAERTRRAFFRHTKQSNIN